MANIIREFFSEKDNDGNLTGSSKRVIAISISCVLAWGITYAICKAANAGERYSLIVATMVFVLVLLGVATFPQIITLLRGGPPAKDEGNTIDKPDKPDKP